MTRERTRPGDHRSKRRDLCAAAGRRVAGRGRDVHLAISPAGQLVLKQEMDVDVRLDAFHPASLRPGSLAPAALVEALDRSRGQAADQSLERLVYHHYQDLMAPIASGSFPTAGMVICPCSGSTLGAIVHGTGDSLIHRAASVHLKERRKLILVPRETPLSTVHLDNMRRASEAGAVVLPAMPGFYHGVRGIGDLVDFVVARICDQLGIANTLVHRWGT